MPTFGPAYGTHGMHQPVSDVAEHRRHLRLDPHVAGVDVGDDAAVLAVEAGAQPLERGPRARGRRRGHSDGRPPPGQRAGERAERRRRPRPGPSRCAPG